MVIPVAFKVLIFIFNNNSLEFGLFYGGGRCRVQPSKRVVEITLVPPPGFSNHLVSVQASWRFTLCDSIWLTTKVCNFYKYCFFPNNASEFRQLSVKT